VVTNSDSKRARVMGRSRKLGHCICDPRKPCPCDLLLEKDVCLCAGERLEQPGAAKTQVELTKLVKNAGCASKIPPAQLTAVLARLPKVSDPRLLVGAATADDAGVFKVSDDLCLVQTVDVFSPAVDDPYIFGRIAACNSLSDIYAMGATPLTALSIIGYPIATLGDEAMAQMLKGGMEVLAEAGVVLVGGHSINDEETKFGFAVTGIVAPDKIVTNAGAQPGDKLILTKPLGTGIIAFAAQIGRASVEAKDAAAAAMTTLNREAACIMVEQGTHACTDVTGFGLLGHLYHIVRESGVTAEIWPAAIPLLPGVAELAQQGVISGATERNREYAGSVVDYKGEIAEWLIDLLYDPQTSGGLLFAVPADQTPAAIAKLQEAGSLAAVVVGEITAKSEGRIVLTDKKEDTNKQDCCCGAQQAQESQEACCSGTQTPPQVNGAGAGAQQAFKQFMASALAPGALDVVQKEIITIALSVAVQCEGCLKTHLAKAQAMGISAEEIQEAAWLGVMFGGCKAMMFWNEHGGASS
jgi:selenide, water dikinase